MAAKSIAERNQLAGLLVAFGDGVPDGRLGAGLQQQRPYSAVVQAAVEVRGGRGQEPLAARGDAGDGLRDLSEEPVVELAVQREQEPRAITEVVEERPLRHAGFLDDEVDAHGGQPGVLSQAEAGIDKVLARGRRALLAGVHRYIASASLGARVADEPVDGGLEQAVPPAGDQWAQHRDRDAGECLDVADVCAAVKRWGEAPQVT